MTTRATAPLTFSLLPNQGLQECTLRVLEGPDCGLAAKLALGRMTIGASSRCDVKLTDPAVSSAHVELSLVNEGIRLKDMGSTNGTFYLDSKVDSVIIRPGSLFRVGKTVLGVMPPTLKVGPGQLTPDYGDLLGCSPPMMKLFSQLRRIEGSLVTVLLEGETGSGKSAIAEEIHKHSDRAGPFVTVDCGAITPSLIQSELFGHKRGAFSGADRDRTGALEQADGGTLFLDEIGELPLSLQPYLLRFLETQVFRRVGGSEDRRVEVRVLAATNRDLFDCVDEGTFRRDLYYRVSVLRLRVPSLRECPEEILPLAKRFLAELGGAHELDPSAAATLQSYAWPGNIRQLRNALQRFSVVGRLFVEDDLIDATDPRTADYRSAKGEMVLRFEQVYLTELMRSVKGNLSAASRASGLVRHHLRTLLAKHEIDVSLFTDE